MVNYYLFIPILIILIFLFPIPILFKGSANIFKRKGVLVVYICGIKTKGLSFNVGRKGLEITEDNQEVQKGNGEENNEPKYLKALLTQIKDKMKMRLLQINYNFGIGDAFQSSLIAGWINIILLIILTRIKSEKPTASLLICDNIAYNSHVFESAIMVKASITLFDLVYSLLYSVILMLNKKQ